MYHFKLLPPTHASLYSYKLHRQDCKPFHSPDATVCTWHNLQ